MGKFLNLINTTLKLITKSEICLHHEGIWGSRGVAPLIFNLGSEYRKVVNLFFRLLNMKDLKPGAHCIGDWTEARARLVVLHRRKILSLWGRETRTDQLLV